jgi:thiamine monophosphate synthase
LGLTRVAVAAGVTKAPDPAAAVAAFHDALSRTS